MDGADRSTPEKAGTCDAQTHNVEQSVSYLEHGKNGAPESSAEVQQYVQTLHNQMKETEYRQFIAQVYDRIDNDANGGLLANGTLTDLRVSLGASDRIVDPQGAKTDKSIPSDSREQPEGEQNKQLDGNGKVISSIASDNSSGMSFDAHGKAVAFHKGNNNDVTVTTTLPDGTVQSILHNDVNPASAKFDEKTGALSMDRVIAIDPNLVQSNPEEYAARATVIKHPGANSQAFLKIGTVKIAPNGEETTVLLTKDPSKSDGTSDGDITVVRDHSGGTVTAFEQNVNGKQISLLKDGAPLPGLTTNGDDLHSCQPGVTVDSNGKIESYSTSAGVQVNLDANGNATAYHSNGFSFEHHQDGWYYHQDSGGDYVKIGTPTVDSNGTVHCKEDGGFNHDRVHTLDGGGQQTSGTIFSGTVRNFGHDVIDDTASMVPNTVGQIVGNNELANWTPHWIDPVDPSQASNAERVGGGAGSALSLVNPIGDEERAASILERVIQHGSAAAKNGANRTRGNASKDTDLNPLHDWNWYNWLTN